MKDCFRVNTTGAAVDQTIVVGGRELPITFAATPGAVFAISVADLSLNIGDVVTIEPGMYRRAWGGCRLEDLVLVTKDGAENLTQYPYDLTP